MAGSETGIQLIFWANRALSFTSERSRRILMGKDLRFALRMIAKSPGFTLMAAVALALGIGANTAIFSVVNAVMLSRLPFENPDRLVMVWEASPRTNKTNVVNPGNFFAWQDRNRSFERVAALIAFPLSLSGDGEPEVVESMTVSSGFFEILGVKPIMGRWFTAQEDTPGNDNVVILSEGLWRRRYGADSGILGRQIRVNNHPMTVVGIMPAAFRFPMTRTVEFWAPLGMDRKHAADSGGRYLSTVARLRPGATVASAQADMRAISTQLQQERPAFNSKWGVTVVSMREQVVGDVRTPLFVLLGAVGLVLLIACANVANLMLMRAAGRGREIAIRAALGAGGFRIARQLLVESILLSMLGGALGLIIGLWSIRVLTAALPDSIAYVSIKTIRIDTLVFLFTIGISFATGILFGLAPALKAARTDVHDALKAGGRGIASGRSITRNALVVAEVALSMILLVGAGLLIRSFARLSHVDPGFDAPHILTMQLALGGLFPTDAKFAEFNVRMLERVRAIPGVEAAGTSHFPPLGRIIPGTGFWRADHPRPAHGEEPVTEVLVVMPGYFAAMNIPIIRGRVFDDRDLASTKPHLVVINQTLARQFYPNEDPVGKRLAVQWGHDDEPYEIAGVVGDVHQKAMDADPRPGVLIDNMQEPSGPSNLVARTHGDPKMLSQAIQKEIHALDRNIPVSGVATMDEYVSSSVASARFNTILLGCFAALALTLASVGIFGVISYSVAQRTQELGIRRALGADSLSVMRLVLLQGLGLAGIGLVVGLAGAFAVTRLLASLLFGVTSTDPLTFVVVAAILAGVALLASYLPARRAASVDPMVALRYE
jgi:putative ABC transport system permease protein